MITLCLVDRRFNVSLREQRDWTPIDGLTVFGSTTAFWHTPCDVLRGSLDGTRLALRIV
jgi:hypothetical protein